MWLDIGLEEGREAAEGIQVGLPYLGAFEAAQKAGYIADEAVLAAFFSGYFASVPFVFTDEVGIVIKVAPRDQL